MKMLWLLNLRKSAILLGCKQKKKSVLLLLGFLLMYDTSRHVNLDRVYEIVDQIKEKTLP